MSYSNQLRGANPRWGRDSGPAPPMAAHVRDPRVLWLESPRYTHPGGSIRHRSSFTHVPAGYASTFGAPRPVINSSMPACNLTNSTGGVGCEPGYNYFFPAEHTKIHVLKTGSTPPWHWPTGQRSSISYHAAHVPVNTTLGELLKGFGATNPNPAKNQVWEVTQGSSGQWYSGLHFKGSDKEAMKKSLKMLGWDATCGRDGKPPVCLYITKD